jgi:predicted transposase YdaD
MQMLHVLTPLEETRAYQELVGIGEKKGRQEGRQEGEAALLRRLLVRRFGALPAWAEENLARASIEELETWGDRVLDAATLTEVLGHPGH